MLIKADTRLRKAAAAAGLLSVLTSLFLASVATAAGPPAPPTQMLATTAASMTAPVTAAASSPSLSNSSGSDAAALATPANTGPIVAPRAPAGIPLASAESAGPEHIGPPEHLGAPEHLGLDEPLAAVRHTASRTISSYGAEVGGADTMATSSDAPTAVRDVPSKVLEATSSTLAGATSSTRLRAVVSPVSKATSANTLLPILGRNIPALPLLPAPSEPIAGLPLPEGPSLIPSRDPEAAGKAAGLSTATAAQAPPMPSLAGGGPGTPPSADTFGDALSALLGPSLSIYRACLAGGPCGTEAATAPIAVMPSSSLLGASPQAQSVTTGRASQAAAPAGTQTPAPAPIPGGAISATASGIGSGALIFFILASLLLLGGSWTTGRLRISVDPLRPAPLVLIPERPG